MTKTIKYIIISYIVLLVVNALLLPPLDIISIDNFLFPFALCSVIFLFYQKKEFQRSGLLVVFTLMGCLLSNYLSSGLSFIEFLWSIRIVKLFTAAWSAYYLLKENAPILRLLITITFIGFVIINALELLEWQYILDVYAPDQLTIDGLTESFFDNRVFGVFTNPNSNGLVLALFGFYYLISEEKNKFIYVGLAFSLLLMTQSRTAFIAFSVAVLLIVILEIVKKGRKFGVITIVIGFFLFLVLAKLKLNNLSSLFDGTAFKSNSVSTRFDIGHKVIEVNNSNVILGQGKINNIPNLIGGSIDNEYLYVYLEYGLIGLVLSALLIILLSTFSFSYAQKRITLGLILIMLIGGLTNLSFSSLEVSGLFMILFVTSVTNEDKINQQKEAHR